MYATFEVNENDIKNKGDDSIIKIDANIQSLSWMSKSSILSNLSSSSSPSTSSNTNSNNTNNNTGSFSSNQNAQLNNNQSVNKITEDEIKLNKFLYYQVIFLKI